MDELIHFDPQMIQASGVLGCQGSGVLGCHGSGVWFGGLRMPVGEWIHLEAREDLSESHWRILPDFSTGLMTISNSETIRMKPPKELDWSTTRTLLRRSALPILHRQGEKIVIGLMTSDRKLEACRESSK